MTTTPIVDLAEGAAEAAAAIRAIVPEPPSVAVVLGSGLNDLVAGLADAVAIPYAELPHFPLPTVAGHAGNVVSGRFDDAASPASARVLMLQGRFHYYEGHPLEVVTFPVRVLQALGVRTLILTAATGGIATTLRPGNLVCLSDHLNLLGENPLRGVHDARLGPRFPDMTEVYSQRLRDLAGDAALALGFALVSGVYACLPGPSYETPAEIRMLRTLGADVVGMSTVPEAIVARQAGMEVLAFALVTNAAAGIVGTPITHQEVLEEGRLAAPRLAALIRRVVLDLAGADSRPQLQSGP